MSFKNVALTIPARRILLSNDNTKPFKKHKFPKKYPFLITFVAVAVTAVIAAAFLVAPKAKSQLMALAETYAPTPVPATPTPLPTPTAKPGLVDSLLNNLANATPPPIERKLEEADEEIYAGFFDSGIDDSKLARMVSSGEIPANVQSLELGENQITDVSPLSSLKSLKKLSLFGNGIADASPLASLESLEELFLSGNSIEDMSFLQSMKSLKKVELDQVQLAASASAISNSDTIKAVDVDLTQDGILASIGSSVGLRKLSLDLNKEVDADVLKSLAEIENIDLADVEKFVKEDLLDAFKDVEKRLK